MTIAIFILGAFLGGVAAWLVATAQGRAAVAAVRAELGAATKLADERDAAFAEAATAFQTLSADALKQNNESFLQLAGTQLERFQLQAKEDLAVRQQAVQQMLDPIKQALERGEKQAQTLEQTRREAHGAIVQQLTQVARGQEQLTRTTGGLATALRAPHVRGRWGEVQLKRVIEYAGMVENCDFVTQPSVSDPDGHVLRPDIVVKLPGGKSVVVDSKTPLDAYLGWLEADDDDVRLARLHDHARQVREHINKLAAKRYWRQFEPAPDFVVMFVPDEAFLRAAQEVEPGLQETAWQANVIVASPSNLIALLRTIAAVWQQEQVAESARAVNQLGRELYERIGTVAKHFAKLGRSLDSTVASYNETVGSLEARVLPTARKFEVHGITGELEEPTPLERQARPLQAIEFIDGLDDEADADMPAAQLPSSASAA